MTIFDMLKQGNITSILGMCAIFGLMVILLYFIGKGVEAKTADAERAKAAPAVAKAADTSAVTAAISAAVNEYRKK
ncbi:MAG: sodium pump decarboxylase subunit gamma [Treponema sp.]|jgi:Na+-transporting methylmalonyl-CoA/oxaloacetate decarboxylase gamma subunit|nr:sodium pump decarboxylase subunit gamma [Treponema sp.]